MSNLINEIINEKFGIIVSWDSDAGSWKVNNDIDCCGTMYNVFFLTRNRVEIEAFVMSNIEEYQEQIKAEIRFLAAAQTKEAIIYYLENYAGWEVTEKFDEKDFTYGYNKDNNSYLLDFKEFKIVVSK